jgi:tetratricopeptide (TPR) repeat protein
MGRMARAVLTLALAVVTLAGCDHRAREQLQRAQARLAAGSPGEAAVHARAALERRPRRSVAAQAAALLGRAELAEGRRSRALEALDRAEDLLPGCCGVRPLHVKLLSARAMDFALLRRPADARRDLAEMARLAPDRRDEIAIGRFVVAAAERAAASQPAGRPDCAVLLDPISPECQALERAAPVDFARLALAHGWPISYPKAVALLLITDAFAPGELDAILDVRPLLQQAAEHPPLVQAAAHRIAGDEAAARAALERALSEGGSDPLTRRGIGVQTLLWGDLVAADRHLRWASALAGDPSFALDERALLLRLAGGRRGEWQLWLEVARTQPPPATPLIALGYRYLDRGEPELSAAAFMLSAAERPHVFPRALLQWWRAAERTPAARDHARATWRDLLEPPVAAALEQALAAAGTPLERARARLDAGDLEGARAALASGPPDAGPECTAAHPETPEPAPLLRVRLLAAAGDRVAAQRLAAEWADLPAARACRYPLAMAALEEAGELETAVRLGKALKAEAPDSPGALLLLGRLEAFAGDAPGAALDLEGYLYHSHDRAAAFDVVARTLLAAGHTRTACGALGRALAFRGGADPATLLALGRCLVVDGQTEAAAAALEHLVRVTPAWGQPRARRHAAAALVAGGALERARLFADPVTLATLGDPAATAAARPLLEASARRRPLDPDLFVARAAVQAAAGDRGAARALLDRARAIRPWSPVVQLATARLAGRLYGPDAAPLLVALALVGPPEARCEAEAALTRLPGRAGDVQAARRRLAACVDPTLQLRVAAPATASAPRASAPKKPAP